MFTNDSSERVLSSRSAGLSRRVFLSLAGTAAAAALALGIGGSPALAATSASSSSSDGTVSAAQTAGAGSADSTTLAETVAAKASPSVGTVQAAIQTSSSQGIAMGSCVLIDVDGHVLTNYHVIEGATEIQVTLNGTDYTATVLGSDPTSDLAVLAITPDGNTPQPIEVGSSSDLALGQWVMTIGAPKGESQSVSQGIVSGLSRTASYELDTTEAIYTGLVQTDAMINEGSSGGALVNADGQLVGITTLSATTTGDWAGMSYAIPSDYAMNVADQIIEKGVVEHPYMGVSLADLTPYNYQSAGSSSYWGAYVASVVSGSPAEQAGLQEGDVITAIDGEDVTSTDDAIIATREHKIGDTVSVTVDRNGQSVDLQVTLGSDQSSGTASGSKVSSNGASGSGAASNGGSNSGSNAGTDNSGNGGVFSFFGGSGNNGSNAGSGSGSNAGSNGGSSNGGYGYGNGGSWGFWSNPGYGSGSGWGNASDGGSSNGGYGYGSGYGYGYGSGASGTPTSANAAM